MNININIQKKDLWLLSAIMIFLVGVGYVVAYNENWKTNPGDPAIHGHTPDEILVSKQKYYIINSINYVGDWAECVKGYVSIGFWDQNNDFEDVDAMKCEYIGTNDNCEVIKGLNSLHGGPNTAGEEWNVECSSKVLVGIGDTGNQYEDIDRVKCCGGVSVNKNDCEVLTGLQDGGPRSELNKWNVQCSKGYVVAGIWDDNNKFSDLDRVKCCRLN